MFLDIKFIFFICFLLKTVHSATIHLKKLISLDENSDFRAKKQTVNESNLKLLIRKTKRTDSSDKKAVPFEKFQSIDFSVNNEQTHQFCGETLFYAVEYYCVYIKGTSVYSAETEFETTNVINSNDETKTKRDTGKIIFN